MAKLFIGHKPGVGGVVKVMANNAYDPLTTPNTAYGKFRFNSETAEIALIPFVMSVARDAKNYPFASTVPSRRRFFWPAGTNAANCKGMVVSALVKGSPNYSVQVWYFFWNRILGTTFPPLAEGFPLSGGKLMNRVYQKNTSYSGGEWISPAPGLVVGSITSGKLFYDGILNQVPSEGYNGYYSTMGFLTTSPPSAVAAWKLPANSAPLPFPPNKARIAGTRAAYFSPSAARIARPGYDAVSGTAAQQIISETQTPARIIKTGSVGIAAGKSIVINCGIVLPSQVKVDAVVWESGVANSVFPLNQVLGGSPYTPRRAMSVGYTVASPNVVISNTSPISVVVRYVIYADDFRPATTGGGGKVIHSEPAFSQIRRPGSRAAYVFNDVLLDTRWAYLPMVKQGFIPIGSFAATPTAAWERWQYGSRRATVTWTNDGTWTPFIKYVVNFGKTPLTRPAYFEPPVVRERDPKPPILLTNTAHGRQSSCCRFTNNSAFFYLNPDQGDHWLFMPNSSGTRYTWQSKNDNDRGPPIGVRYYVFAIPNAL